MTAIRSNAIAEKRHASRVPMPGPVWFVFGGRRVDAVGRDLSANGASFYTDTNDLARGRVLQRLLIGSAVRLFLTPPSSDGSTRTDVHGHIVRFAQDDHGKFVAISLN